MDPHPTYKAHLFICTNHRDKGQSCAGSGSQKLRDELKTTCKEKYGKTVRINNAGCLGQCEKGIVAVLYPQTQWFTSLNENDGEKLAHALEENLKSLA